MGSVWRCWYKNPAIFLDMRCGVRTTTILRTAATFGVAVTFALPGASAHAVGGLLPQGGIGCEFSDSSQVIYVDPSNFETPPTSGVYIWFSEWLEDNDPFFPTSIEYILSPSNPNLDVEISFQTDDDFYGPIDALDVVYDPNFDDGDVWGPTEWPGLFLLRAVEVMGGGLGPGGWSWGDSDADDFVSIILDESSYPLRFTVDLGDGQCTLSITYRIADRCSGPYGYLCEYLEKRTQPQPATALPSTL